MIKYYLDAIVSVKLESTSIARSLIQLGCWENIRGQLFNDVVLPQLRAENDALRAKDKRFAPIATRLHHQGFAPVHLWLRL